MDIFFFFFKYRILIGWKQCGTHFLVANFRLSLGGPSSRWRTIGLERGENRHSNIDEPTADNVCLNEIYVYLDYKVRQRIRGLKLN